MRLVDADALLKCIPTEEVVSRMAIANAPTIEPERMKLVQEAVNTIMHTAKTDSIKDKCFRNAARFIQNAIDGKEPDFERIPDEPERKKGKWINNDDMYGYYARCSECGYQMDVHAERGYHRFCPNCGADMRGDQG